MKSRLLNSFSLLEHFISSFTRFSEEDNLSQEADEPGMSRIKRSNLVTSARAWFSSSSCIISATSWILESYFSKSAAYTDFRARFNTAKSNVENTFTETMILKMLPS